MCACLYMDMLKHTEQGEREGAMFKVVCQRELCYHRQCASLETNLHHLTMN